MYDQARETAENWDSEISAGRASDTVFCGVPFLLKDLIAEYEGAAFHEGSRAVKGYISKLDSQLVKRQKAAGLVIVGKTNTPEFGSLPTTEPTLYGPTINPWDPGITPGGSSGGSAAAVAAGIVPMAHGKDGGYDLLLSPTMRIPPSKLGAFELTPEDPIKWLIVTRAFIAFTRTQNLTGQPAMSVPLFWNADNIPIGVQFAGRFGDEATLFRLAGQLEQARPWADKKPPIHCSSRF